MIVDPVSIKNDPPLRVDNFSIMFRLNKWRLFLFLWIFRLANSFIVSSYIDPDEFWQSLEPAHRLVFGYGYLTWEWRRGNAIRSWLFPLLFASTYKLLQLFGLDDNYGWLVSAPKLIQSLIATLLDYYTILLGIKHFGSSSSGTTVKKDSLFLQGLSYAMLVV